MGRLFKWICDTIKLCNIQDAKVVIYKWWREDGVIGHGGCLRLFPISRLIRGSGHAWGIYPWHPQTARDWNLLLKRHGLTLSSAIIRLDSPQSKNIWGESHSSKVSSTGMIASSSTFRPHPGRAIRDLFHLLSAVQHCTEALVYSNSLTGNRVFDIRSLTGDEWSCLSYCYYGDYPTRG